MLYRWGLCCIWRVVLCMMLKAVCHLRMPGNSTFLCISFVYSRTQWTCRIAILNILLQRALCCFDVWSLGGIYAGVRESQQLRSVIHSALLFVKPCKLKLIHSKNVVSNQFYISYGHTKRNIRSSIFELKAAFSSRLPCSRSRTRRRKS